MPKGKGPNVNYITLDDGTQIPYAIPPHIPPEMGEQIIAHLKSNPEAAKQALAAAQQVAQNPAMVEMYSNLHKPATAGQSEVFAALRDDPEMQPILAEVQRFGPGVMQKYLDDDELMAKISRKLREKGLSGSGEKVEPKSQEEAEAEEKAALEAKQKPKREAQNLFDAATQGDLAKIEQFLSEGADINGKNDKGISVLGLAVGFNKPAAVEKLLEKGADVDCRDSKDNTPLHYAAGYGRQQCAEVLLKAGADVNAKNGAGQTPIDAARMNSERGMVSFLQQRARMAKKLADKSSSGEDKAAADKADPLAGIDLNKLSLEEVDALLNSLSTKETASK